MNSNKTTESVYARPPRPMTYGRLNTWAEMPDPGQLVLFMSAERKQLEQFLQSDQISPKMFSLLLKAVDHALTAHHQKFALQNLLEIISQTKFFNQHLVHYFYNISMSDMWDTGHEEMEASSRIVRTFVEILPSKLSTGFACVTQLANILNTAQEFNGKNKLLEDLKSISDLAKKIHSSKKLNAITQSGKQLPQDDNVKPPDDFRTVKVVPALSDFKENGAIFIRPSKSKGVYDDVSQYLDIQFRLMREDFLIPLRQGISELRKHGTNRHWKTGDLNLRLYRNVRIDGWELDRHILIHWISFDTAQTIRVNWKGSKRLINGSVVCLSSDNFKTMIFAIVDLRDKNDRENGLVSVVVESGYDVIYKSHPGDEYIMAESTTLFEPYRHVLVGLQASYTDLPLTDYILKCRTVLKPPRYLLNYYKSRTVPKYNLSCLMKSCEDWECPVLTTTKWPPCESMCLNKSQREAAILALTKEMVLIQGPPGTGKTYVGLKVMETIMKNLDVVFGTGPATPILIVCYTNHALDQFLEGILKFCDDGIVRVGGGSKSEQLKEFNLNEKKQSTRKENLFNGKSVSVLKKENQDELNSIIINLDSYGNHIDNLKFRIMHENVLSKYMDEQHYLSLYKDCQFTDNKKSKLSQWLHAPHSTTEDNPQTILEDLLTKLVLKWDLVLPDMTVTLPCDIIQRASLYCTVASRYKEDLKINIENSSDDDEIKRLGEKMNAMSHRFLMDQDIQLYLTDEINNELVKTHVSHHMGQLFKVWVLGLNNDNEVQIHDATILKNALQVRDSGFFNDNTKRSSVTKSGGEDTESNSEKTVFSREDYRTEVQSLVEIEDLYDLVVKELGESNWIKVQRVKSKHVYKLLTEDAMDEKTAKTISDISKIKLRERFSLYNLWCRRYRDDLIRQIQECVEKIEDIKKRIKQLDDEEILFIFKTAKVIGMTTTGAAKHRDVLQAVGSRIVVVEEAAEVFESHIITALNPQCNHLILIGDHQQLRPKPNVYELARHYGLEVSLFERLIKNNVPHVVLKVQHRMRPEISKLMRHIYPELEDDDSVLKYEHIRGVGKDVFFINHNFSESQVDDSLSKENIHEAVYIAGLCKYLINKNHSPSSITILTTYTGQVIAIRNHVKKLGIDRSVRIVAVDDFQGEENDIILLSLVRSNEDENVGFLKVDNRICVALSRAKKGLYVIGNFDLLASQSKLWSKIVSAAKKEKMFGEGLPIFCRNHPENKIEIKTAHEFITLTHSGCGLKCEKLLSCGHSCALPCHSYDLDQKIHTCSEPCSKTCSEGHPCTKQCAMECGQCQFPVLKSLPCGHDVEIPCGKKPEEYICLSQCSSVLQCSHQCSGKCGDCLKSKQHKQCQVLVNHTFSCGDVAEMPCYKTKSDPACKRVCGTILDCKHSCTGTCSTCSSDKHVVCSVQVSYTWTCGHVDDIPCHVSHQTSFQCNKKCCFTLKCTHKCVGNCLNCANNGHSPCKEICGQVLKCGHCCTGVCSDCLDGQHVACNQVCGQVLPCEHKCQGKCRLCDLDGHLQCTELCQSTLTCGHQCQGKCGVCSQSSHPTCLQECQKKLPCGHKCRGKCGDCKESEAHPQCQDKCNKTLPCGHKCIGNCSKCYERKTHEECQDKCSQILPCGHTCVGKCGECNERKTHQECGARCNKIPLCGHACPSKCGQPCPPCQQPCPNSCRHRSCRTNKNKPLCGELCQPCMKKLVIECPHQKMTKLCKEMWQTPPCEMKCTKTLKMFLLKNGKPYFCRHPCSGLCNEICVCTICERIFPIDKNILIPNINERTESERLVLKIPSCSHIFYVDELDKYMKTFDQNGTEYIGCPECSHPIMNCLRYDNILKERRVRREALKQLSGAIGGSHLVEEIKEIKQSPDLRADEQTNSINNDSQNSMIVQLTSASEQRFSDNFGDSDATILKAQGETLRKIIRFQNRKDVRTVNPRQFRSQSSMENTTRENSASLNWRRRGPESSGQEGSWRMSSSSYTTRGKSDQASWRLDTGASGGRDFSDWLAKRKSSTSSANEENTLVSEKEENK
ncbi:NFX1-type zinc finger-containing protein 1-like [Physella acuta]|uniref:NFX1-type zinc finger-containing protein 1-like n=1 Tax=Physella acuta TaxID=109671 RepID=UPI0027DD1CA4|nr:NFX1-type zinc finger-containing protein 1-like [Physella acuta]